MQNNINPINAVNASMRVKPTYGFVSTREILNTFESKGWQVVSEQVQRTKVDNRQGFQKHLIRLEHPNYQSIAGLSKENSSKPQLCLVNSHDGTSSLRLFYGLLRIACLNGIIAGSVLKDFRAIHNANIISNLNHGIEFMTEGIGALSTQVQVLQNTKFSQDALSAYVKLMVDARLKNVNNIIKIDYDSALRVTRHADYNQDAFTAFNVVQEKLVRGGIRYQYEKMSKNEAGTITGSQIITTHTKRLTSIDSQIKLNRQAYNLAIELAS